MESVEITRQDVVDRNITKFYDNIESALKDLEYLRNNPTNCVKNYSDNHMKIKIVSCRQINCYECPFTRWNNSYNFISFMEGFDTDIHYSLTRFNLKNHIIEY